jgi:hypothetical protein
MTAIRRFIDRHEAIEQSILFLADPSDGRGVHGGNTSSRAERIGRSRQPGSYGE